VVTLLGLPPVIGHRGAALVAPENTLASFRQAALLGARMVEFDVRLSADGRPVVFHDDTLDRTSNGSGPVAAASLAELKRLDAGGWFSPQFSGEAIPTLDEVLALCLDLGIAANIELKPERGREVETAETALACALRSWPPGIAPPLVSSFSRRCLAAAGRTAAAAWPRGLLVGRIPADWHGAANALGCHALHADQRRLSAPAVAQLRAAGLTVLAYTVNDPHRAERLWAMGVTSIFSDFPMVGQKN
jgi:glycerophosphoryl diester phosphodiesterase